MICGDGCERTAPDWKPGKVDGQKVKSGMSLYVDFRLEKNTGRKRKK